MQPCGLNPRLDNVYMYNVYMYNVYNVQQAVLVDRSTHGLGPRITIIPVVSIALYLTSKGGHTTAFFRINKNVYINLIIKPQR